MTLDWHKMAQGPRTATWTRPACPLVLVGLLGAAGCGIDRSDPTGSGTGGAPAIPVDLAINELVSDNEGTSVDERGETDDWIELINVSGAELDLAEFTLIDSSDSPGVLPEHTLAPDETIVLWADDTPAQGVRHLPFKLSADGDTVQLWRTGEPHGPELTLPPLQPSEAYARFPDGDGEFARCRYASPGRLNADRCEPPKPADLPTEFDFSDFTLSDAYGMRAGSLMLSEAALRPAAFIELVNVSDDEVSLAGYLLRVAQTRPGEEFPGVQTGVEVPLPADKLGAGERRAVPVAPELVTEAIAGEAFEGVVTLFDGSGEVSDRWDFIRWPDDAVLARYPTPDSHPIFCRQSTPDEANTDCDPLPARDVGDRLRHLYTPGDFIALAEGAANLGMAPVKFVYDLQQDGAMHLLSSRRWALHYTFVRELIDGEPPLDRCIPAESAQFNAGWYAFSQTEYYQTEGRRYLLGTLVHHGGADLHTVEYALGDRISGEQMRDGFYAAMRHVITPSQWALRPQDAAQATTALSVDGELPIVDPNAPFIGVDYQPLTSGIGYGTLRYVPTDDLPEARLGPDVIVVTDDVPNDIALVGGLITEALQTPLAHVNVLSRSRDTPNMALRGARGDDRVASFLEQLVRLEVRGDGFTISAADPSEAEAFWETRRPAGPVQSPRLDLERRAIVDLTDADFSWLPSIGAKAAQLAELGRVTGGELSSCTEVAGWRPPAGAIALPVVHFREHFEASGAAAQLEALRDDVDFRTDPLVRSEGLETVRELILAHPVDEDLLATLEAAILERFGTERVRLRSSSNAEDLPGFNGAGLYTSTSVELDDPDRALADGLRLVWSSLYHARAYDERELARIEHTDVAMGVLIHRAFRSEAANGVAISRNILDPIRSDIYYLNAQEGEASVTNPAPGVTTEQLVYRWPPRMPPVIYQSQSSLIPPGEVVLDEAEVAAVACAMRAVHDHFLPLLDPDGTNPWFAMESEFKLLSGTRELVLKQARPHDFGDYEIFGDCREL